MALQFDLKLPRRNFDLELSGEFGKETIGIFGPSGAGKTSFFSLLVGLERPSAGRLILNGRVLTDVEKKICLPVHKRRIGVVFQEKLLFPHLTVKENLLFGERYVKEKKITLDSVVELLDLGSLLDSMPRQISGGEQQRTAIGRALLTSPELLLLDEPFNAVDNALRMTILPYLKRLRDELEIPLLVISHDLPDIQRLTNIIFLIDKGKSRGFGNIFELFSEKGLVSEDFGLVNTFSLYAAERISEDLYSCRVEGIPGQAIKSPVAPGEKFTMIIEPGEIALANNLTPYISIQNQLPGKVITTITKNQYTYCLIDAGIKIVSKVTRDSVKKLQLRPGKEVYCLFKSHSLSL